MAHPLLLVFQNMLEPIMDIKKSPAKSPYDHKKKWFAIAATLIITMSIWSFTQPSASTRVASSQIWTDTVKVGDLKLEVEGYGKLKSTHQRLLTAPANATVEEVLLKPGSLVQKGSVIVRLSNPDITQRVKAAQRDLQRAKAKYLQIQLSQKRELLAHQATQEQLQSDIELANLTMRAEEKLMGQGVISELTFKRSQLNFRQLSNRISIESKRLTQLIEVYEQERAIEQGNIAQKKEDLTLIKKQFDRLTVKAGIDGVVHNLSVELGQSVVLGEQIALVGSVDNLYALLNISQTDAERVALQQSVEISTRSGTITGKVHRINPLVKQGMITIEVTLQSKLPNNARPDLNIDGVISTGMLTSAMYIKKPVNAGKGKQSILFRTDKQQRQAEQIQVQYGEESGEFIQIISGATEHDRLILSDLSRWNHATAIVITH